MKQLKFDYIHCDVFTNQQMKGNSLSVFFLESSPEQYGCDTLLSITREMKHFESIFVRVEKDLKCDNKSIPTINVMARIFACSGELDFAGHPLIGAASSIHDKYFSDFSEIKIQFSLNDNRSIFLNVTKSKDIYQATMSQGVPQFVGTISSTDVQKDFMTSLNLTLDDYDSEYPMEIVSTGLKYLIIPVKNHEILNKARIIGSDFNSLLIKHNAEFIYLVDLKTRTARSWENDGSSEDAATGSAAGPFGAYLVKHGLNNINEIIQIKQGEFMGRDSNIMVEVINDFEDIKVSGNVCMFGYGNVNLYAGCF